MRPPRRRIGFSGAAFGFEGGTEGGGIRGRLHPEPGEFDDADIDAEPAEEDKHGENDGKERNHGVVSERTEE